MRINEFIDALSTATDDYYTLTTKNTLDKVLNLIEINLLNPDLTLSFISESINISESYISRIFHKTMGVSFKRYLTKERMDYAKKHLLLGEKISDISDRIGYTSPNSFMRAFKNITGTTIGQYLKSEDRISM